jgi:hypothetical protein
MTPCSILPSGPDRDAVPGCGLLEAASVGGLGHALATAALVRWHRSATDVRLPLASFPDVLVSRSFPTRMAVLACFDPRWLI